MFIIFHATASCIILFLSEYEVIDFGEVRYHYLSTNENIIVISGENSPTLQ